MFQTCLPQEVNDLACESRGPEVLGQENSEVSESGGMLAGFRPMLVGTYIITMTKIFAIRYNASHWFIVQITTSRNAMIELTPLSCYKLLTLHE